MFSHHTATVSTRQGEKIWAPLECASKSTQKSSTTYYDGSLVPRIGLETKAHPVLEEGCGSFSSFNEILEAESPLETYFLFHSHSVPICTFPSLAYAAGCTDIEMLTARRLQLGPCFLLAVEHFLLPML